MPKIYLVLSFLLMSLNILAQQISEKGIPNNKSYLPQEYRNPGKVWDIQQAPNGLIYFATEKGLLSFNGQNWNLSKGSKGYMRSLAIANDSIIYVGSDADFGYFKKNEEKDFDYISLYPYAENNQEIEEFWNVHILEDRVVFQSFSNLYVYQDERVTQISAPTSFTNSFKYKNKLYIVDDNNGIYTYTKNKLELIAPWNKSFSYEVKGVFYKGQNLHIVTQNNGIQYYNNEVWQPAQFEVNERLQEFEVFSSTLLNDKFLAFGTIFNGIYITDLHGNIIQHVNRKKGLINNTILDLFYSKEGNLWTSMDYGLGQISLSDPNSHIADYNGDFGNPQTALLDNDNFYLGTNQGLYVIPWDKLDSKYSDYSFKYIPNSSGQVWTMERINDQILVGHDKGLYVLDNNTLNKIADIHGAWEIVSLDKNTLMIGSYNGIHIFKYDNDRWKFLKKIPKLIGATEQIISMGNGDIWVFIPNYAVVKVTLDPSYNLKAIQNYPIEQFKGENLNLMNSKGDLIVKTDTHTYKYNIENDKFTPLEEIQTESELSSNKGEIKLNNSYAFQPSYNGFVLKNYISEPRRPELPLPIFTEVIAFDNNSSRSINIADEIDYKLRNLSFTFTLPPYTDAYYQYRLDDDAWSPWQKSNQVKFVDLASGNHTFIVRSKVEETISDSLTFKFTIAKPWHLQWYTFLIGFIILLALWYGIHKYNIAQLKKQKLKLLKERQASLKELDEKHKERLRESEKLRLENERILLEEKVRDKTIELAKTSKEMKDQSRALHFIRKKLDEIAANPTPTKSKLKTAEIRRHLDNYIKHDDQLFEMQIDELHQDFIILLKEKYPELTTYDLRLATFLKMGMKTKEIAEIIEVLPSSINVSRSRLRKKLGLKSTQDLYAFFNNL